MSSGGELVLVATPIGNLGDLSPRAVGALRDADRVCCEDTRRTRALMAAAGVRGGGRLLSLHAHNEQSRLPGVLAELEAGKRVALVTDAGMPGVSDPGGRLVAAAVARGIRVTVVPGPSAVLAALVVSGLASDRFSFEGFLPRRRAERLRRLARVVADERTIVLFEAPGRVAGTLGELAALAPDRRVAVCRELTKVHEEVWRGTLADAAAAYAAREVRGEVVIVVAGGPEVAERSERDVGAAVEARLEAGDSARDAAVEVAASLGVPRRVAYEAAIAARRHAGGAHPGEPPR